MSSTIPVENMSLVISIPMERDGIVMHPAAVQVIVALLLIPAVLYGTIVNTFLFVLLIKHPNVSKHAGSLMLVLLFINICHSAGPSFTLLLATLNVSESVSAVRADLCTVALIGRVFTNSINLMIMTSMAVQRYLHVISRRPAGCRFVVVSVVIMTTVAMVQTIYQFEYPGLTYYICTVQSDYTGRDFSGIRRSLALPFIICCGMSIVIYVKIFRAVKSNPLLHNHHQLLVRPMLRLLGTFLFCYAPFVILLVVRRWVPVSPAIIHSHRIVSAINALGHAISPSMYCLHSKQILQKLLRKLYCWHRNTQTQPAANCNLIPVINQHQSQEGCSRRRNQHEVAKRAHRNRSLPLLDIPDGACKITSHTDHQGDRNTLSDIPEDNVIAIPHSDYHDRRNSSSNVMPEHNVRFHTSHDSKRHTLSDVTEKGNATISRHKGCRKGMNQYQYYDTTAL